MRRVSTVAISALISKLSIDANIKLRPDIYKAIKGAIAKEKSAQAKAMLKFLLENSNIALNDRVPICQDTGLAVVFMEIGQDIKIVGGPLKKAVDSGVRDGYKKGYLRKSIVRSPVERVNTNTNTPAILHTSIVPGKKVKVWVMPKGFGSENKSKIYMLNPGDGKNGIVDFMNILRKMTSFDIIEFGVEDIVRSGLVKEYLTAKIEAGF